MNEHNAFVAKNMEKLKAAKEEFQKKLKPVREVTSEIRYERREPHRPVGRADDFAPSRHEGIAPCMMLVLFNSHRATFELAYGEIRTLPDNASYDLRSLVSHQLLGRVKVAPEKNSPLVDRVEFPNEWFRGDDHGLEHDGLHGDGEIYMRLDWKVDDTDENSIGQVALVKVVPWLAYGCGEGARVTVRNAGAIEGSARPCCVRCVTTRV